MCLLWYSSNNTTMLWFPLSINRDVPDNDSKEKYNGIAITILGHSPGLSISIFYYLKIFSFIQQFSIYYVFIIAIGIKRILVKNINKNKQINQPCLHFSFSAWCQILTFWSSHIELWYSQIYLNCVWIHSYFLQCYFLA